MRFTKYSKWSAENWDDLSLEELMNALSDFLLESGFNEQMNRNMRRWQRGQFRSSANSCNAAT